MHPPVYGAYTNLWAGVSDNVRGEDGGRYIVPWGAWHPGPREDLLNAMKSEGEGGSGEAGRVWEWLKKETNPYS